MFKFLRIYCRASAIAVAAMGGVILGGWAFHIELLKSVFPGGVAINANMALLLALSGTSLWLLLPGDAPTLVRYIARFLAMLVTMVGAATRIEYLFGVNLGIDQLLFTEPGRAVATSFPGRMAPTSAMSFTTIGLALLVLEWHTKRGRRPSQGLSLWPALVALVAITSYTYRATAVNRLWLYTQVPMPMAIAVFLLSGAVFFARPRTGIAGDLTGEGSGSAIARRLLPAVFFIPLGLGWICLYGYRLGLYGTALGLAIYSASSVVVFGVLVWLNTRKMNMEYAQRSAAETEIRILNAELEGRVAERTLALEQQTAVLAQQAVLLDLAHDAIVVHDMRNRIVFWNRGAEVMYGWPAESALGTNALELLEPESLQPIEEINAQLLQQGHWEGDVVHHKHDGTSLLVNTRWTLQRNEDGAPARIFGIYSDITERKQAECELQSLTERLSLATAVARVGVWDWQLATNTFTWDATMFEIYGLPPVVPVPYENWSRAVDPEDLPAVEATLRRVISEKGQGIAEFRITRADGAVRHVSLAERVVLDKHSNVTRVIGVNRDVTEQKEAEEALRNSQAQLSYSAQHDFLTGLPNRMLLNDRVNQAIVSASRLDKKIGVLFLDLDGFKHINDSLGHPIGDKLLQSIAKRLVKCVRATDTVSRQGGDEFVVLLSEMAQSEDAAITARRLLQSVADAHSVDQHDLHVSASIGVSVYPDDGLDAETLIKNADTAMYQAKDDGRQNYQFFKPAMNVRAVARQSMEESLRRALERQEFALAYQPKVSLKTGKIIGAEALLRWTHPTRGPVSPAEFIPVAEDSGLIVEIDRWVLREACRQARAWVDAGPPLITMAVNVSAIEFRNEKFLEGIFATLTDTGLDPRFLELELTESLLMKRPESTESILKTLRARGVQLAVDDFGTGYSSLSYLRKFSMDVLKIDKSFVRQITTAPNETSIVTAMISMGRSLNLRVVAEGVETQTELAFLQARQCDEAQGFYFSRPVPSEQFAKLLSTGMPSQSPLNANSEFLESDLELLPSDGRAGSSPSKPDSRH
jgi:diguanylate cyclase (GGDEF)-like protein/PAS domain S-box-containing protein